MEDEPSSVLVASIGGFCLHAGSVCESWQRSQLERLCRYITRAAIATKRSSVDLQGRVVYRYKLPFRDGSTHVVLEPLDFMARLAALAPAKAAWRSAHSARSLAGVPISACGGRLRVIVCTRDGFVLALLALRANRPSTLACAEEPAVIRKILTQLQAREEPAGLAARAPPEVGHQESELL